MLNSVSIYKGGIFIDAENCNYQDYKILGLRCPECGEEVYLKRGEKKASHFAHFKKLSEVECSQRFESIYEKTWQSLSAEGKGQRQELFRLHFLKIIKNTFNDFCLSKESLSVEEIKILSVIYDKFIEIKTKLISIQISNKDIKNWDKQIILNHLITREAIDYLCLKQNKKLLELIILYIIKVNSEQTYSSNDYEIICFELEKLLLKVNWNIEFTKISPVAIKRLKLKRGKTYELVGYEYYHCDQYDLAIPYLTKAIKITPADDFNNTHDLYRLYAFRSSCYQLLGKYEDAIDDYNQIINLLSKFLRFDNFNIYIERLLISAYQNRAYFRGQSSHKNKYELSLNDFIKVITMGKVALKKYKLYENDNERNNIKSLIFDSYDEIGSYYLSIKEDYETAIKYFSDAISFSPITSDNSNLINLCAIYNGRAVAYYRYKNMLNSLQDHKLLCI